MVVITILLILFFLFASSIKITGWQKMIFETQLEFFGKYGLNRNHMLAVGFIECTASVLLIASFALNQAAMLAMGSLGIMLTSLGAIYFHLRFDTIKDAIPAIITLILSATLLHSVSDLLA